MIMPTKMKVPTHLSLTAFLSGGLTLVLSSVYTVLCILAIVYRFNCEAGAPESATASTYFWNILYRLYIQKDNDDCEYSMSGENHVDSYTIFILLAATLCTSLLCFIITIALFIAIRSEVSQNVIVVSYVYVTACLVSLTVDVVLATFFGVDYGYLTKELNSLPEVGSNYELSTLRYGAFVFMAISLKGFIAPIINIVLIVLLIIFIAKYRREARKDNHSIHKLGALNAYEQQRRQEETWVQPSDTFSPFRGAQINTAYMNDDEPPKSPREPRSDYSNRSFDRSDSWHHTHPSTQQGLKPFSYLEDIKRTTAVHRPASPEQSWSRDPWPPAPPIPAPDYSPQPARRLKSALKSAYM